MDLRTGNSESIVGVRILDCDHREITEAILELQESAATQQDRGRVSSLLNKLRHFTSVHFALEEGMMAATRYPKLALHRLHHQRMMEHMRKLLPRFDGAHPVLQNEALGCLAEWHTSHVQSDDLHYGHWLNGAPKK